MVLQANNPDIGNGTDVFTLKVAPKIINGRAMISLEGVKTRMSVRQSMWKN